MPLEFIPGNREILAIVAQSITGPYRFVHDARHMYVRIGPATEDQPITITPSAVMRLTPSGPKTLYGKQQTLDVVVVFLPYQHLVDIGLLPKHQQALAMKALAALEEEAWLRGSGRA